MDNADLGADPSDTTLDATPPGHDAAHVRTTDAAGRDELEAGLGYLHTRVNAATARALESASFVYALIELLVERGLITVEDIDARKQQVTPRLLKRFEAHDPGVALQHSRHDKYQAPHQAVIDCDARLPLCRAVCCKMVFPLSQQDLDERIIHWQPGQPYVIAKGADGYCRHLERHDLRCTVHEARPLPCRVYDCRGDRRVWLDFEHRVINPKIADPSWPHNLSPEERDARGQP